MMCCMQIVDHVAAATFVQTSCAAAMKIAMPSDECRYGHAMTRQRAFGSAGAR
jgi:hypothetical protein